MKENVRRIAIIGGGPAALFMFKRLVDAQTPATVDIFERNHMLGAGMPYSEWGACDEHITNVSPNEIPDIVDSVKEWIAGVPERIKAHFNISSESISEYKVMPRLLFGRYLADQFDKLIHKAKLAGVKTNVHLDCMVKDIIDNTESNEVNVETIDGKSKPFDQVVICTGHNWPSSHEGDTPGYYDSPYPPSKLKFKADTAIAIRGSSLTAIDAVRTLSRNNGIFSEDGDGYIKYTLDEESKGFKMVMHSLGGFLPALRFHLEDSHLQKNAVLSKEAIQENMAQNEGFLSLDYIFEKNFKEPILQVDPEMYQRIKLMNLEEFVEEMMSLRENIDAFTLFKSEYAEAEKSIKRKESVHWKEMLAVLSFAMNYPAKHFSAEDMLRLQKVLKPLISIVIAFVPQSSASEMIALHNAGVIEIVSVDKESTVEPGKIKGAVVHYTDENNTKRSVAYEIFIDAIGQPQLNYRDLPFPSLLEKNTVSSASLKFQSPDKAEIAKKENPDKVYKNGKGNSYLRVPGISIDDNFQVVDGYGVSNPRIFMMAVPYIGGYNPDYSGLDFCEAASERIIERILEI